MNFIGYVVSPGGTIRNFAIGYGNRLVADRLEAVKREMKAIEDFARNLQEKPL